MARSSRFRNLEKRLAEACKHFLPARFSPTGIYTVRQLDRARAYRLLVHAEIESFIEDIANAAVMKKVLEWQNRRTPSDLLIAFLACYHAGWSDSDHDADALPESARKPVKNAAEDVVTLALGQYQAQIKKNNGIKEKNFKRLIIPTGVRMSDLDPTWLANLDTFGQQRGVIAHTSVSTQQTVDPKTELNAVQQLMIGLKALDELVQVVAK